MEETKAQPVRSSVASLESKLRYPLRSSAARSKEGRPALPEASRRENAAANVSKSVVGLDFSSIERTAKPPRRHIVPAKSASSPLATSVGSITPLLVDGAKSCTPSSEASRSTIRRRFDTLSSASYWLTQIKLAESSSKHTISLGFFKLALESGCEPLQWIREELKSYACRHNIVEELGEPAKDLLQSYNILEEFEKLKVSKTCSALVPAETPAVAADGTHLLLRSLNLVAIAPGGSSKANAIKTKAPVAPKNKASSNNKNSANPHGKQNKSKKPSKATQSSAKEDDTENVDPVLDLSAKETSHVEDDSVIADIDAGEGNSGELAEL